VLPTSRILGAAAVATLFSLATLSIGGSVRGDDDGTLSLVEAEPDVVFAFRRYPRFYGDSNTLHGDLEERTQLLGDIGGLRNTLVEHGIYFDLYVTQYLATNATGGAQDSGRTRYSGSADYWLTMDTAQLGLWPGGAAFVHGETSWGKSINSAAGSLLPANFDGAMPKPDETTTTLSEAYLAQGLPGNLLLLSGKADFAGLADNNLFANNERTQFSYTGLVNNPLLGPFVPYTTLGAGLIWAPSKRHTFALVVADTNGTVSESGFDTVFDGNTTIGGQYQYTRVTSGLPGNYRLLVGYTSKDVPTYEIDERHLIGEVLGLLPTDKERDNYTFLANFDQYLWVEGGSVEEYERRVQERVFSAIARGQHLAPRGIGIFGRIGWAPEDRNAIDQFYSLGIGGWGMGIAGRKYDLWGIGWAGSHISSDLRSDVSPFGVSLDSMEHAIEAFYNFEIVPSAHLTLDAQWIDQASKANDTVLVLQARLQLYF
jgi:carbohydrate-selective porin OprB